MWPLTKYETEKEAMRRLIYELLCRVDEHEQVVTAVHPKEWTCWLKKARSIAKRE
jgi:hypothetical protein